MDIDHYAIVKNCPRCDSDGWKSARLVVLEGITTSKGEISGKVTDPGALSGGTREFLLSDRWFSWDYPVEASLQISSTTGLVDAIKELMIDGSASIQIPPEPSEPEFPSIREPAVPPKPLYQTTLTRLISAVLGGSLIGFFVYELNWLSLEWSLLVALIFIAIGWYAFKQKQEPRIAKYQVWLSRYDHALENYKNEMRGYQLRKKKWKNERQEWMAKKEECYKERELLWDRGRICTRCGAAYFP